MQRSSALALKWPTCVFRGDRVRFVSPASVYRVATQLRNIREKSAAFCRVLHQRAKESMLGYVEDDRAAASSPENRELSRQQARGQCDGVNSEPMCTWES